MMHIYIEQRDSHQNKPCQFYRQWFLVQG